MGNIGTVLGFAGLAGLIVVIGFVAAGVRKRNYQAWANFAGQHGLTHEGGFLVTGSPEGRLFKAAGTFEGTRQKLPHMRMFVGLRGEIPELEIVKTGFLSKALIALGAQDIEVGDPEFDRKVVVRGKDPVAIQGYLTSSRRTAVLRMIKMGAQLSGTTIVFHQMSIDTKIEKLSARFVELMSIARELDVA